MQRSNKMILMISVLMLFPSILSSHSLEIKSEAYCNVDSIYFSIQIKNISNDDVIVPISYWHLPMIENRIPLNDDHMISGAYNYIDLYTSKYGSNKWEQNHDNIALFSHFPSFVLIKPQDSLIIEYNDIVPEFFKTHKFKRLNALIEINYANLKDFKNSIILAQYLKDYPYLILDTRRFKLDRKNSDSNYNNLFISYKKINKGNLIDSNYKYLLNKYLKKYEQCTVKINTKELKQNIRKDNKIPDFGHPVKVNSVKPLKE